MSLPDPSSTTTALVTGASFAISTPIPEEAPVTRAVVVELGSGSDMAGA